MKMRNKGKVHPFTSSSSNNTPTPNVKDDALCVLNLLPAAVFTLLSVLSVEDREVLAYMITRSLKSSMFPAAVEEEDKKKMRSSNNNNKKKKQQLCCDGHGHKSPALFDCECFHCYTSFWFRWDSSPNRELIHQAIEAFEDHLNNNNNNINNGGGGGDPFLNNNNTTTSTTAAVNIGKSKRKDKMGRRKNDKVSSAACGGGGGVLEVPPIELPENEESLLVLPEGEVSTTVVESESGAVVVRSHHKGLARKVLPDVIGIFNSRLWSLWSPNV
ncbi:hypothetical protein BUALT_Bualt17G0015400 [Buddleja alternifolia]|uniref:Uncharacterized protein n=1 Tax=Buddleja alternifolia TaxID=168488 RepID=A0AAV6W615_9LAMI|nr:hypothetical protein BUALT_Bualt17G0015400 [Buddleja alternifolia]